MFVDHTEIMVQAGRGGNGLSSFRTEKYVPRGGPDGGNGGKGGDVVLRADSNANTLAKFRHHKHIESSPGRNGKPRKQQGRGGEDQTVIVPVGTQVYESEALLVDLTEIGQTTVVARGGRGGFGNAHFVSSTRQAPRMAELGEAGEEKRLKLELKLIADVGLVGLPNAGKSTLLSIISNARPKVANYPFTTLEPQLGIAEIFDRSLVVADIPGLIEGASEGKGLGIDFLRHLERTKVLLHLIDPNDDVVAAYRTIQTELIRYQVDLSQKPQLVVITKSDSVEYDALERQRQALAAASAGKVRVISAVAHKGVEEVLAELLEMVDQLPSEEVEVAAELPVITLADDPDAWWVETGDQALTVRGEKIEGFARRTDFASREAMQRLRSILHKRGIDRELVRRGATPGSSIDIAGKTFKW